jgi:hypothetical protein
MRIWVTPVSFSRSTAAMAVLPVASIGSITTTVRWAMSAGP